MSDARLRKYVLVDTGFWFGLCDEHDQHHEKSLRVFDMVKRFRLLFPWPVLYEVLNTRFIRHQPRVIQFDVKLRGLAFDYIEDQVYRQAAYEETMALALPGKRQISLVDMVVRHMLADVNLRVDYLVTYNDGDFTDICKKRKIELVN